MTIAFESTKKYTSIKNAVKHLQKGMPCFDAKEWML